MAQETQTGALYQPGGVGWGREMGGRFETEGICVYLWLIHGEVLQKTAKFCKAIILQLKKKLIFFLKEIFVRLQSLLQECSLIAQ